jgi:hypothetical protein
VEVVYESSPSSSSRVVNDTLARDLKDLDVMRAEVDRLRSDDDDDVDHNNDNDNNDNDNNDDDDDDDDDDVIYIVDKNADGVAVDDDGDVVVDIGEVDSSTSEPSSSFHRFKNEEMVIVIGIVLIKIFNSFRFRERNVNFEIVVELEDIELESNTIFCCVKRVFSQKFNHFYSLGISPANIESSV